MSDLAIPLEPLDTLPLNASSVSPPNFLTSSWDDIEGWFTGKNADTTGMSPSQAKAAQQGKALQNTGLVTAILGGVSSAFGAYYAAKSAQNQERSQASSFQFQADMAAINASRAELTAQSIQEAGKSEVANYTMRAGQEKAGATAEMAGRGIALGVGSTADVAASMDIEKDLNVLAINQNTTRQAWGAREQATNYQNESLLDRTSAANATRSANSIGPTSAVFNSLLSSATQVAGQWDWQRWMRMRNVGNVPQVGVGGS
jgi:head-tail adaptor